MHVKSLVLGAAVAFQAATAVAESPKPRIYFPRHIKRQFTNTTITSPETFPPPESTPFSTESESRNFITSFRSTVSDLLSSDVESSAESTATTASEQQGSGSRVTTIVVSSTIRVPPPAPTSPTTIPELSFPPFSSTTESETVDETTRETSTDDGTVTERDTTTEADASTGGFPPIILFPTESDETTTESTSSAATTASTSAADETTSPADETTSGSPTIVIGPTGVVSSTASTTTTSEPEVSTADSNTTTDVPETTAAPTTSTTSRLLDPIISIVSDLLPSLPANDTETTSTTTTELPDPTTTPADVTTTDGVDVTSVISSITSLPTLLEPSITPNSTETDLPGETSTPPAESTTTSLPAVESSATSFPPEESQVPSNTTSDLPPPTASETTPPSVLPSEPGTIGNETSTLPEPSVPPTDLPQSSLVPSEPVDVSDGPTSTAPPAAPTTTADEASTTGTATVTDVPTSDTWMGGTIIADQSTPSPGPTTGTATTALTMPSDLPKVIISPDDADMTPPEGTVLLQVGFLYAENYKFVTENPMAAAQIFTYLPIALADGASISLSKVKVTRLVPFDTTASLGYITTLARFYYPESMVDKLRMDIKIPNSLLYNHRTELVYNLTSNINPAIDIIPGNESELNSPGGDGGSPNSPNGNNDILGNSESQSTPMQKGTAAAIGIGAVGVAAAYGAAMFLVARRYKQKKQAHRRSSSIANSSEMRYAGNGSPAMMGGALLSRDFTGYGGMAGGRDSHGSGRSGGVNSVRTAQISAPVAAENSLGWN